MQTLKKVLIVDDEYTFGKTLKEYLERVGFSVGVCTDGAQALDIIKSEKPDLITLDIRMPGINGYDILDHLGGKPDSPIIVVISGIDTDETEQRILKMGAKAVFHKPVNLTELVLSLKVFLLPQHEA